MSKTTTILSLETGGLRGMRVTDGGRAVMSAFWPLAPLHPAQVAAAAAEGQDGAAAAPEPLSLADSLGAPEKKPDGEAAEDAGMTLAEAFRAARRKFGSREAVMAMPLASVLSRCIMLPAGARDDLASAAAAEMEEQNPFPDETLAVGCEQIEETASEIRVFAAAVPDAVSAEIAAALSESGMLASRTDVLALGWVRTLWPRIAPADPGARTVAIIDSGAGLDVVVADATGPVVLQSAGVAPQPREMSRHVTLALIEAERTAGARKIEEIRVFSRDPAAGADMEGPLGAFAPVARETIEDPLGGIAGVAARMADKSPFDATPAAWAAARRNARFKRRLALFSGAALAVWAAAVAAMVCGPVVYGSMESDEAAAIKAHAKKYRNAVSLKSRVDFLHRYSDRSRSALAALLAVTEAMPAADDGDITLTRFEYQRESVRDGEDAKKKGQKGGPRPYVHITGTATGPQPIYAFRDSLAAIRAPAAGPDKADGGPLFPEVELKGEIRENRGGRQGFTIDAYFDEPEAPAAQKKKPGRDKGKGGAQPGKGGA